MIQVPEILRARGYRLYPARNKSNQRLIDLWLNGGAAVLGHTPPNMLRELKNAASRGLYAPLPHFTENRFIKALKKLFPERNFRMYAAPPPEVIPLFNSGTAKLWRPFTDPKNPLEDVPLLIPVLPGIQTWRGDLPFGLCIVAYKPDAESYITQLPPDDKLPPILLATAARGVHDLFISQERAKPALPRINKVFSQQTRWQRNGIYLTLKNETEAKDWDILFTQFLKAGFLMPPIKSHPLILPGELSAGEEAKLALILKQ